MENSKQLVEIIIIKDMDVKNVDIANLIINTI